MPNSNRQADCGNLPSAQETMKDVAVDTLLKKKDALYARSGASHNSSLKNSLFTNVMWKTYHQSLLFAKKAEQKIVLDG